MHNNHVPLFNFVKQSWIDHLWDSLSSVRYSVLHLFQKWFNVFARCLLLLCSWLESISSLCELTVYPRLSGRLSTRLPTRRCDGVRGSSKSLDIMYDRGLELVIDSIFTIAVCNSSSVSLACPTIFLRQRLVDFTVLSITSPHQGAFFLDCWTDAPALHRLWT